MPGNEALPYTRAAKLVTACGSDKDKLAALKTAVGEIHADADANADYYMQQGRTSKLSKKDAKKATLKFWFNEERDRLDQIVTKLENGKIKEDADGTWRVEETSATKTVAAVIGLSSEWEKRAAVSNFFDKDWDDLSETDVQKVHDGLPKIREYLQQRLKRMKAAAMPPMRASTDKHIDETEQAGSKPPEKQEPSSVPANG